jgi:hypothetical protein
MIGSNEANVALEFMKQTRPQERPSGVAVQTQNDWGILASARALQNMPRIRCSVVTRNLYNTRPLGWHAKLFKLTRKKLIFIDPKIEKRLNLTVLLH